MRAIGSHNYSRSAPALQLNVDLLSAKGSKEPIDSSHETSLSWSSSSVKKRELVFLQDIQKLFIALSKLTQAHPIFFASRRYRAIAQTCSQLLENEQLGHNPAFHA